MNKVELGILVTVFISEKLVPVVVESADDSVSPTPLVVMSSRVEVVNPEDVKSTSSGAVVAGCSVIGWPVIVFASSLPIDIIIGVEVSSLEGFSEISSVLLVVEVTIVVSVGTFVSLGIILFVVESLIAAVVVAVTSAVVFVTTAVVVSVYLTVGVAVVDSPVVVDVVESATAVVVELVVDTTDNVVVVDVKGVVSRTGLTLFSIDDELVAIVDENPGRLDDSCC